MKLRAQSAEIETMDTIDRNVNKAQYIQLQHREEIHRLYVNFITARDSGQVEPLTGLNSREINRLLLHTLIDLGYMDYLTVNHIALAKALEV